MAKEKSLSTPELANECSWTEEEMFAFWEDPENFHDIVEAVPVTARFENTSTCTTCSKPDSNDHAGPGSPPLPGSDSKSQDHKRDCVDIRVMQPCRYEDSTPVSTVPRRMVRPTENSPPSKSRSKTGRSMTRNDAGGSDVSPVSPENIPCSIPDKPKVVTNDELIRWPYCSVGKLFWLESNPKGVCTKKKIYHLSAFYVGKNQNTKQNEIITAAHAFDCDTVKSRTKILRRKVSKEKNICAAFFVPAMKNKNDIFGENFGFYSIKSWQIHPQFKPCAESENRTVHTPQFDICRVQIGTGKMQIKTGIFRRGDNKLSNLRPISLTPVPHIPPFPHIVLGYTGTDGVMVKVHGTFKKVEQVLSGAGLDSQAIMEPAIRSGMSGGPWLSKQTTDGRAEYQGAIGCQSASSASESFSPFFNNDLVTLLPIINKADSLS